MNIKIALILLAIILSVVYFYFPRNLLHEAKLNNINRDAIEVVNFTVLPNYLHEESVNVSIYDRALIDKVLGIFQNKYIRKRINNSASHDQYIGMFISIIYNDSGKSEKKISTIDMLTSNRLSINTSRYVIYGEGIDHSYLEELLREVRSLAVNIEGSWIIK